MPFTETRIKIISIYVLFALSGFSGLIYESVWTHYIKLILGHAAYAQTLVLVTFMGGLALGAWLVSRKSSFFGRPFIWYIGIELLLGVFGVLFHYEFLAAHNLLFDILIPATGSPVFASILKWLVAFLVLLPQAILLGATFPLIGAAIIRIQKSNPGETLSALYFSNSFGAVIGILVSGFILIEYVGLPGTSLTAGVVNILLAVSLWLVTGGIDGSMNRASHPDVENLSTEPSREKHLSFSKLMLIVAFLTGLSSFFYEIAWIRMLSLVLSSSMQAFELMLSAFILGLALGGLYIRKRADNLKQPIFVLGWIQMAMGVLAIATLPVYAGSFDTMAFLLSSLNKSDGGYTLFNLSSHMIAMAVMIPATFMAGMTLPLITTILFSSGSGEKAIGRVYAANTVGAISGIVIAINILMPLIGATRLIVLGGVIDILVGVYLVHRILGNRIRKPLYSASISAIAVLALAFSLTPFDKAMLASGVYRFGNPRIAGDGVPAFYKDGRTASISFIQYPDGSQSIGTNGKTDALFNRISDRPSGDEYTMVMLGALAMLHKPDAEYAANIGLGSGLSTHILLASDSLKRVDTIEIEKQMVAGARNFGSRVDRTFNDPRSRIVIDDAKSFFSSNRLKYDVITSEPSNPWISGISSLFTREYYQQIKNYLRPEGIFLQWLQVYDINLEGVGSVLKAIDSEFKYYTIYNSDDGNLVIVASDTNSLEHIHPDIFSNNKLVGDLARVSLHDIDNFNYRRLGDRSSLSALIKYISAPVNSDYFPYLSYSAPRSQFKKENTVGLSYLHTAQVPVVNWLNKNRIPRGKAEKRGDYLSFYSARITASKIVRGESGKIENTYIRWAMSHLTGRHFTCSAKATGNGDDIDALVVIGGAINPYLHSRILSKFWKKIGKRCADASHSNPTRLFLQLQTAIANYDSEATIELTKTLMSSNTRFPSQIVDYLILAQLTASLDAGDRRTAIDTVIQYNLAARMTELELPLRLVVANVLDRPTTPGKKTSEN